MRKSSRPAPAQQFLYSLREAARLLRVSRTGTLGRGIERGLVRVTMVNGRARISHAEIERLARQGIDVRCE